MENGENVIFFANHQSEADPQVMSMLLQKAGFEGTDGKWGKRYFLCQSPVRSRPSSHVNAFTKSWIRRNRWKMGKTLFSLPITSPKPTLKSCQCFYKKLDSKEQMENGENVIFFANHQSEADPQV